MIEQNTYSENLKCNFKSVRRDLIGTVISTTFNWNKENATLTLVANFNEILFEFIQQTNQTNVHIEDGLNGGDKHDFEKYVILIQSGETWGSGCFVNVNGTRMIITCAHVIGQVSL